MRPAAGSRRAIRRPNSLRRRGVGPAAGGLLIVIDTSAVVSILLQEADAQKFARAIETDDQPLMSAATLVELNAVMFRRRGPDALQLVERFLALAGIAIVSLTETQAMIASEAYARYGTLNFGDCFSYALAKERDLPLLYKGDDFGRTDVLSARPDA